jgi:hypothetical protein
MKISQLQDVINFYKKMTAAQRTEMLRFLLPSWVDAHTASPKKSAQYFVTLENGETGKRTVSTATWSSAKGATYSGPHWVDANAEAIIAWQIILFPEPYDPSDETHL